MKRILLDTHVFLWWIDNVNYKLIGPAASALIADTKNEVYISAASVWEIAIKKASGALSAPDNIDAIIESKGFSALSVTPFHAEQAGSLPMVNHTVTGKTHKDPFDRMLIAQAQAEGMYLMSKDSIFSAYSVRLLNPER